MVSIIDQDLFLTKSIYFNTEGVGKTSIIETVISENFPRQPQKVYHPVTISPNHYILPNNKVYT